MQFKDLGNIFGSFGDLSGKRFKKAGSYDDFQNYLKDSFNATFGVGSDGISKFNSEQIEAKANVLGLNKELRSQALALASDATLSAKAATGKLTYADAIKDSVNNAPVLVKALQNQGKLTLEQEDLLGKLKEGSAEYNEQVKKIINANAELGDSIVELPESASKAGTAFSNLSNYFKGLLATLKTMLPLIAAVGAAFMAYRIFKWADNKYNLTYDTNLKNVKEHVTNLQNAQKEVENLNAKADQYKQTLQEIASNYDITLEGTESVDEMIDKIQSANGVQLTLVDQTEIEKIQLGNDELERTLNLKEQLVTSEQRKAANDAKDLLKKAEYMDMPEQLWSLSTKSLNKEMKNFFKNPGVDVEKYTEDDINYTKGSLESYLAYYHEYQDLLDKAIEKQGEKGISEKNKKKAEKDEKKLQKMVDSIEDELQDKASDFTDILNGLSVNGEGLTALSGYEPYFEKVRKMLRSITDKDLTDAQKALNSLSDFFDGSFGKNALKAELKESAGSAEELQKALAGMGLTLDDIGIDNISYLQSYLQETASSAEDAADAINTVEGSVASVTSAFNADNQDVSWKTMAEYLAQADELFANGQIGIDDFKEAAQFMTQKKINPDDGFSFDAQAYEAAWKEAQDKVKRYFDNEDQFQSAENFLTDLQNVGLAIADGNNDFQWTENFNSSADAADKLGISVSAVEVLMHNLEAYGAEFDDMLWSGDVLDQYKSALNGIKTIYDSMEEGATKDRYKNLIDGWDEELAGYENDLSTLTSDDVVVRIQFEYSLASIQQQIDQLQNTADEGGDNQTWAELNASKRQYLKKAESANTSEIANLDAYKEASSYVEELKANLASATDEETKNAIQRQISSVYDAMKYINDAFIDSGQQWSDYYQSDQYKSDYKNFEDQLKSNGVIEVDADTTQAKEKIDSLTNDTENKSTTIDIDADIDKAKTALENLKNDDGTLDLGDINTLQAYNALKDLLVEKQELEQPAVMTIDTNKFSEASTGTINKLQEFQRAYEDLNAQNQMKDMGFDIDTSEAKKKVQDLYSDLKDNNLVAQLKLNTDDADSFEKSLGKLSEDDIKLHVDGDTSKLDDAMNNSVPKEKDVTLTPKVEKESLDKIDQEFSFLKEGHSIQITANVDGDQQLVEAIRGEDNTITFQADLNGVKTDLQPYLDEQGNIAFTVDGSQVQQEIDENVPDDKDVSVEAKTSGEDRLVGLKGVIENVTDKNVEVVAKVLGSDVVQKLVGIIGQVVSKNVTVGATVFGTGAVSSLASAIGSVVGKVVSVGANIFGFGKHKVDGTAHSLGTAYASGNWGAKESGTSLVGELGTEIVVDPATSTWRTIGDNGAEFVNIKKGQIVFNHRQSEELLKNGYVTSGGGRGKLQGGAFVSGTAFGNGSPGIHKNNGVMTSNKTKKENKSSSSKSYGGSSRSSSGGSTRSSSGGSSSSSDAKSTTEEVVDFIKIMLSRLSRMTELATDAIERAVGLANKQAAAADAIGKATNEMVHNQRAADAYLAKANSISLSDAYKNQIMNGSINIDTITDEDLKKKISDFQSYYESYLSARDNALKLEDKITELAEKRLEIIEKEYDAIVDINDSIKDVADSKISLNDALGVAIDNPDNYASINKSIKAQEDTYNQLTKKLSEYQKEMESQLSSGLMQKGSDAYNSALKNIQDFTAKIYDASTSLLELRDKLDQIKIDTIQNVIDGIKRNSDITEKYISYLQSQNRDVPENLYTDRIDNNNAQVQQNLKQMEIYRKKQAVLDVNSKSYQDYAEKIQTLKENTLELITDNESLQDSIYELRFKPLDDAIQKYSDLEDELKSFRDLLNDDAFLDKQGRITEEGLAQVALLQQSIGTAKQKIADYTTGLQKLKESYDNGVISLTEYNDKSKDYREGIQGSIADVKSYQDSLVDLYKNAMSTEVDYLDKIISKQKNLLDQRKSAYEYEKKVTSQSNDINKLKAEIIALQGSNNLSDQSRLRKLQADLKSAESDLQDTKRDHAYDMQSQGFDKLSSDLQETLDNTEYEISHNADKQLEIINSMLGKAVSSYQEAYGKINSIIKNTGWVGSTDFNTAQSDLGTETGAKNQNSNASQSQSSANQNPSSAASGTKTDPIQSNDKANSDLADQLVKPEDTTNRKVAELKVSPTSTTLEEGKSTSITATIRPNDAANKTLAWKSSNESIATVSNGTVKAKKPGSCTITATTTDGSGLSAKVSIKVNAKPKPPKPQPKPQPAKTGGDGIPRVGDVVTFTGSYYNNSWGMAPKGSRFSGQPGAVVIDSYTAREYGGNGRTTGDFKIHIKSAHDPNYSDLGWVRLSQISGYEKGTDRIHGDQLVWTNENKDTKHHGVSELIYRKKDGAVLTPVQDGDSILPANFVSNLAALSAIDPREFGMNVSTTPNLVQTNIPQNISNVGNVTVTNHYDSLLNVEGNVDRDALPGLQKILEKSYTYTTKKLADEYGKLGHKIIM